MRVWIEGVVLHAVVFSLSAVAAGGILLTTFDDLRSGGASHDVPTTSDVLAASHSEAAARRGPTPASSGSWSVSAPARGGAARDRAANASMDVQRESPLRSRAELVATLERRLGAEPVDEAWAQAAEAGIAAAVAASDVAGLVLRAVECRASLCRIRLHLADDQTVAESVQRLASSVPWDSRGFVSVSPEERGGVVVYAAREGRQLPLSP